jgi:hypothetical protein
MAKGIISLIVLAIFVTAAFATVVAGDLKESEAGAELVRVVTVLPCLRGNISEHRESEAAITRNRPGNHLQRNM